MLESLLNKYCIFFCEDRMEFGWIEKIQKNKLQVIPLKGKKQYIPANRIAFSWKDKEVPENSSIALDSIFKQINEAKENRTNYEVETMHSLLDNVREYSLEEISEHFLDDPKNPIQKLALFISLREDCWWFKKNRNFTYTPRTKNEIEILKIQLKKQEIIKEKKLHVQNLIKKLESGNYIEKSDISPEEKDLLKNFINLLTDGTDSKYWKEMSSILDFGPTLGFIEEKKLLKWLSLAGSPISHSKLILLRANVKESFCKEIYSEVKHIKINPLEKTKKIPYLIPTYTVDAKKTFDYDDAFSVFEWNKKHLKIAVHITDLSNKLNQNGLIFKEAESRISSVYTLEDQYPMLPKELSNETFSLKSGEQRNVISFFFQLSSFGEWNLLDVESRRINVQKNLSYEEANILIESKKEFWYLLYQNCLQSQKNRISNGALNIFRKEFDFDIKDSKNIKIFLMNRDSPANRIIEELAISVNSETGNLFQKSNFPGIYRTQSSYEILKKLDDGTPLSIDNVRINPTRLSTIPDKHAGLGCKFYMQVTSPIRRFSDLITQSQLKCIIGNKSPLFSEDNMLIWSEEISFRQKKYKRAESEIINYWKLLFLKQNSRKVFKAKTRKKLSNGNTEVELLNLDLIVPSIGLGNSIDDEIFFLKINHVDIQNPKILVTSIKNANESDLFICEKR